MAFDKRHKLINQMIGSFWEMQSNVRSARGWTKPDHHPISRQQVELLFVVSQYGSPNVKEIADSLGITSGAVSQLIEHLVEEGMLERGNSSDDRRIVQVRFTRHGAKIFKHFQAHRVAKMTDFLSALDDQELAQFTGLLDKMMRNFADKYGGKDRSKKCKPNDS